MRIYEGAPRQNYEDILRSVGAILDQRGMREVTVAETDDGFMVQGLAVESGEEKSWGDPSARSGEEVKLYIGYLRRKLDVTAGAGSAIETVRGFGYRYKAAGRAEPR